jgi:hypothetical protein
MFLYSIIDFIYFLNAKFNLCFTLIYEYHLNKIIMNCHTLSNNRKNIIIIIIKTILFLQTQKNKI